jgi:hypothetical protein
MQSSGEHMRQRVIEAELLRRRRESRRFGMQGYSKNLHEVPNEGSLALESSKLVVATVQNRPVLCPAEYMMDDDDMMVSVLQNLAASKRQKDRVPSAMILHRHLQKHDPHQFVPRQDTIVHQKIKGLNELENDAFYVHVQAKEQNPISTLPNISEKKAVASKFLQLFDLDSSRTGRTNEISVNHPDTSRRDTVSTPVKGSLAAEQFSWASAPGRSAGYHMPLARLASANNRKSLESSPVLELAAPYSKNYVENYMSKVRHSRLGANRPVVSIPKELVRNEKATNGACGIEDDTFVTSHQRWQTADSVPHSSPSRTTQDNLDDHVWEERDCDTADLGTESPLKEEDALDPFERLERERMLEQVQKMYSDVPIQLLDPTDAFPDGTHAPRRNISTATKSLHVVMPSNQNEERVANSGYAEVKKTARHLERTPLSIGNRMKNSTAPAAQPKTYPSSPLRMSVNIMRPFESMVNIAEKSAAFPTNASKRNQHRTPIAIMFGGPNLME